MTCMESISVSSTLSLSLENEFVMDLFLHVLHFSCIQTAGLHQAGVSR